MYDDAEADIQYLQEQIYDLHHELRELAKDVKACKESQVIASERVTDIENRFITSISTLKELGSNLTTRLMY